MTHTELILLLSGISIGVNLTVATHYGFQIVDNRRDRKRREAEETSVAQKATELLLCHSTSCRGHEGPPFCEPSLTDTYANAAIVGTERRV